MFEYQSVPRVDERRDVLSEIDAGELDEQYLVKNASDYGQRATSHPLGGFKAMITDLLNGVMRVRHPKQIREQVKTVLPSVTRQVVESRTTRR